MPVSARVPSRLVRLAALCLAGAGLAACSSTNSTQSEKTFTERFLFAGTKLPEQKETSEASRRELGCPSARILEGTGVFRSGDAGGARGVAFQAAINDLARECNPDGQVMRIRVGVQGRVLLGDSGKSGTVTVPLRVAVRGNGETVYSRLVPLAVTIPPNDTQASFVVIDDQIALPITGEDPGEYYSILVGIDPQGARPERRRRR
jgi:hypothetical protein